jgi:hypothetical protein
MSCPTVIRVTTQSGPPGIGLPAGVGDAGKIVQKVGNDPYAYGLVVPGAASLPQALDSAASPTFAGLTISGLPANRLVFTGTGGVFSGLSLGSGLSIVGGALVATGGSTDLGYNPATRVLSSSTGAGVTLPLAGTTEAGLQTPEHRELARKLLAAGVAVTAANAVVIPHIHGDVAGTLYFHVKNVSGGPLTRGTPISVVGAVGDTTTLEVEATNPAVLGVTQAHGILYADLAHNAEGHAVLLGELQGANAGGYALGAPLWVDAAGGLTSTRPASRAQQVATVGRAHATTGTLLVCVQGVEPTPAEMGAATAAQGALAGTAVQPAALAAWWQAISSATGRAVVEAADQAAARTAIGAGVSNLAVGATAPSNLAASAAAGTSGDAARADHVHQFPGSTLVIPLTGETASLTVSTLVTVSRWPESRTLTELPLWMVNTAPAGSVAQFDIRVGGTSIFSTLPTIDATEQGSDTAAVAGVFSAAFVAAGQVITQGSSVAFLCTQIGSSTAGAGAKVALPSRRV